jgi:hypothetical protein
MRFKDYFEAIEEMPTFVTNIPSSRRVDSNYWAKQQEAILQNLMNNIEKMGTDIQRNELPSTEVIRQIIGEIDELMERLVRSGQLDQIRARNIVREGDEAIRGLRGLVKGRGAEELLSLLGKVFNSIGRMKLNLWKTVALPGD